MGIKEFLKECHNRSLFKLLSVYIVSGWGVIQVFSVINEPLKIPQQVVTYVILLLLVGLPIYMYILWRIRLKDAKSQSQESVISNIKKEINFKRKYFIFIFLIGTISLFSAAIIYENSLTDRTFEVAVEDSDKIAVLDFNNNTGNLELDVVGIMSSDWIIHGITEHTSGEVISPSTMRNYANLMGVQFEPNLGSKFLEKILKPDKLITGSYYLTGDELVFNCVIQNAKDNTVLIAFPKVSCDQDKALECIEEIKQKVLGYLYGEQDQSLRLQEDPPKYEAYEKKLMADANYENEELNLKLLNESIALDSTYFEPQVLRVQHFYNQGKFEVSDSLNKLIANNPKLTDRQRNLLDFCEALIDGKNDRVYRELKYEYDIAPSHLATNSSIMVILNQFINRPDLVKEVFDVIPMEEFDIDDCIHCKYRYLMMGTAFNSLKQYDRTVELLNPVIDDADYLRLDLIYADALLKSNNTEKLDSFIDEKTIKMNTEDLNSIYKFIGERYLLLEDRSKADFYYNKVLSNSKTSPEIKVDIYFNLKEYDKVRPLLEKMKDKDSTNTEVLCKLASSYYQLGQKEKASTIIDKVKYLKKEYDYGDKEYNLAVYFATIGDEDEALKSLLISVANGNFYYYNSFQNDPIFKDLAKKSKFKKILTYWH